MERISALIEKLRGQFAAGADIEQLLLTTQLLEGELRYHRQKGTVPASPHVAVLMPNGGNRLVQRVEPAPSRQEAVQQQEPAQRQESVQRQESLPRQHEPAASYLQAEPEVFRPESPAPRPEPAARQEPPSARPEQPAARPESARALEQQPGHERYLPQKETPVEAQRPAPEPQRVPEPQRTAPEPAAFNPIKDVPTLTHQIPQEARNKEARKDLNDAMGRESGPSLNDALKGQQRELSAVLTDAPIRDLRKAIGINDRYVFISELFRGDEIMYERSIKTINNFSIYQEAYYWMERELKLKLAWDEDRKSAQLFYQLVRRRFA